MRGREHRCRSRAVAQEFLHEELRDLAAVFGVRESTLGRERVPLQPFEKRADGTLATRDMMLYRLPWPKALLQAHGEADLRLRVTLSYFIEPNPGSRAVNTTPLARNVSMSESSLGA